MTIGSATALSSGVRRVVATDANSSPSSGRSKRNDAANSGFATLRAFGAYSTPGRVRATSGTETRFFPSFSISCQSDSHPSWGFVLITPAGMAIVGAAGNNAPVSRVSVIVALSLSGSR